MSVTPENRARYRATLISREVKWLFMAAPERFQNRLRRWCWRWLFLGPDGKPHRAGEIVLAELRREAGYERASNFDANPQLLAYREGKRALAQMIFNYLNLDEEAVHKLMRLDDGLE